MKSVITALEFSKNSMLKAKISKDIFNVAKSMTAWRDYGDQFGGFSMK